ncbi:class I histocompatibility antigen, Gogo-OKO alpha chain-like [Gracilinanus agilis]|uniref:class I histocompatibility antigen, Gogo-OKO alpha chain-like n=1 Tax=Gracilinanus agilis TaxID=191870 RepID=UPI001CFD9ADF|nr:class I histocompatibility antigen, Gogo-OKO alpha chain-like [Gracilinanus agilis]
MKSNRLCVFLLETLVLTESWAGSHSLKYFYTVVTRSERPEPRFISVGYVDDQEFVRFDSYSESQRLEPRAPWMDKIDQDYWEEHTRIVKKDAKINLEYLETLRGLYNQSEGGIHTLQKMFGCELSADGSFRRGFKGFAYDGRDYLLLDTETFSWVASVPEAVYTKRSWEADRSFQERHKAYLKEECVLWLHKYLEIGKDALLKTEPPLTRVTHHPYCKGEVTLRCWAQGFYPADISLTWLRDGEEQLQDVEFIETRPSGDGTFQKWAAVEMTSGQEGKYTCRVQHEGLPEPLNLKWESHSFLWIIWVFVGVIALVAGVWFWKRKNAG